jgi:hypothetical protein
MNNNLYHWHDERMVDLEMQAIRREVEQANLFRQAGGESWLARALGGLLDLFKNRNQHADRSTDRQSHTSRKHKAT